MLCQHSLSGAYRQHWAHPTCTLEAYLLHLQTARFWSVYSVPQSQLLHRLSRDVCPAGRSLHEDGASSGDGGQWYLFQCPKDSILWYSHSTWHSQANRRKFGYWEPWIFQQWRRRGGGGWWTHCNWRGGRKRRVELWAGQEGKGQVKTEDEESKENSGREASSCTSGVSTMHPSTQVLTPTLLNHVTHNTLNLMFICYTMSHTTHSISCSSAHLTLLHLHC